MKTSIAQQNKDFIPSAAMPRIWWVVLASVHQMTEQRQQATYPNICRFMNISFNSSQLYSMVRKGLLVKDENSRVVYGLTDMAYEFLSEYSNVVSCEQDAVTLGFYSTGLRINMMVKGVAA